MVKLSKHVFQLVCRGLGIYVLALLSLFTPSTWASQLAIVLSDQAIVYSDREMSSPIGYIRRGKKLVVGEIPRNNAQVYPIRVSGKIAYIRVVDVTTEKESVKSTRLVSERFQKSAGNFHQSKLVVSYFTFNSQINISEKNDEIEQKDTLLWQGISLKAEAFLKKSYDLQVVANYMLVDKEDEAFRVFELGVGGAYRLNDNRKFLARVEAQALLIPFSTYAVGDDFIMRSYGFTLGSGFNITYLFNSNWGAELFGGIYYTKLQGFKTPPPYRDVSPSFIGNRIGLGVNYSF